MLLQLFLYFSVQIETENYKFIYESQFMHFIKWHKICVTLVHFMTNFELQLEEDTKFFSYFWLQLVRMKSSKKLYPQLLITFLLFEILAYITLVSFEIGTKNRKSLTLQKPHILLSSCFHKYTPLLQDLCQRFFELELEHCQDLF